MCLAFFEYKRIKVESKLEVMNWSMYSCLKLLVTYSDTVMEVMDEVSGLVPIFERHKTCILGLVSVGFLQVLCK